MAYEVGRKQIYIDNTTPAEEYTTAIFDSMTGPLVEQICGLFGMHIITNLTIETTRGHRYFIGYEDSDPKFAIGWAVNNTNSSSFFLIIVGMYEGQVLVNVLDSTGTGTISNAIYYKVLLTKPKSSTTNSYYFNYMKDTNYVGISAGYAIAQGGAANNTPPVIIAIKINSRNCLCYKKTSSPYSFMTYDYYNNGIETELFPDNIYFPVIKNYIGNSDYEYIVPYKAEHGSTVNDLYIYSKVVTSNKTYKINGEFYYALNSGTNMGTYMIKVNMGG